mmetsp:Transcript_28353/g.64221  ORF Transcript_28353/g.64221 Transcript_28353/m.64221 type:complete len:111 (+) Transcript_28353:1126-1458(+)
MCLLRVQMVSGDDGPQAAAQKQPRGLGCTCPEMVWAHGRGVLRRTSPRGSNRNLLHVVRTEEVALTRLYLYTIRALEARVWDMRQKRQSWTRSIKVRAPEHRGLDAVMHE